MYQRSNEPIQIVNPRFPPLPRTVSEVARLTADNSPDTQKLVRIVNLDPIIAAAVLKRVNSAYYGLRQHVGNITDAIILLGFQEVCRIVLTESMLKLLAIINSTEQARIFDQIMRLSVGAAAFTSALNTFLGLRNAGSAVTASLLHTSGRLVLLYNRPDQYEALWKTYNKPTGPTAVLEQGIFHTDHIDLGTRAVRQWNLPEDIVTLIGAYTHPEKLSRSPLRNMGLIVATCVSVTRIVCSSTTDTVDFYRPEELGRLAISSGKTSDQLAEFFQEHIPAVKTLIEDVTSAAPPGNGDEAGKGIIG